ncbi:flippase-like domain-containing protein [Tissierella sp. MSJ-40]|uniref:Phosphatidylglycerol lysyltransferase n=1 Tax=Tissierella simiarum TaxID=2841534 RepID=A0ABS6E7V5_9FIRM|nr:lysylphosphatidylglycerol synthase transmembrane domain-containing protein [Tissierella simiarum]MBU5438982.1 flippase-like domain-containing protein [Tissierella simiarum]
MKKYLLYLLGGIGLVLIVLYSDWKAVWTYTKSISIEMFLLALILQLLTIILITIQWKFMILWIDKECSFINVFRVNMKGNFVDAITPGVKMGGELARAYEIHNRLKLNLSEAAVVVGLQKTVSLLSFLFLTVISLVWFFINMENQHKVYFNVFFIGVLILTLSLLALILVCIKPNFVKKILSKLPFNIKIKNKLEKFFKEYNLALNKLLIKKDKFLYQMLLGMFIWLLFAFKMGLVVKGFNIKIGFISIAAITYLTYIVGMIPLLPGSIGSFESTMVSLLAIKGVPIEQGIAISVIFRFITFWFEFWISLIVLSIDRLIVNFIKGGKYAGGKT